MQSLDSSNGKTFWKKTNKSVPGSMRAVYGAMHPPIISSPKSSPRKEGPGLRKGDGNSFQDFQASVNDAWDCADDEFSVISDVKISAKVIQSTALSVINNHRIGQLNSTIDSSPFSNTTSTTGSYTCSFTTPAEKWNETKRSSNALPLPKNTSFNQKRPSVIDTSGTERDGNREDRFAEHLRADNTNLSELRKFSWSGIPPSVRGNAWRLLCGYLPANAERREETLQRKRNEYWSFVRQYYHTRNDELHSDTYRQIKIDIPRMSPLVPLFQQLVVQEIFERILYIWAIRHPASGYVQGMNDLVTPFFLVFLYEFVPQGKVMDTYDVSLISSDSLYIVESDTFWCMSKLLDGIQDNYTFAQPGIQTKINQLRELIRRIDVNLHCHLEKHEIDYLQFSFRWFNNVLMREMPLGCIIRLWDALHAEQEGFSQFVLYVCAAFLTHFSEQLMEQQDFQSLMILLQNLPTSNWSENEISVVLAEAFRLKYVFADAPNHLPPTNCH